MSLEKVFNPLLLLFLGTYFMNSPEKLSHYINDATRECLYRVFVYLLFNDMAPVSVSYDFKLVVLWL